MKDGIKYKQTLVHESCAILSRYIVSYCGDKEELMLSYCGAGEDPWESFGQQGVQTNQS